MTQHSLLWLIAALALLLFAALALALTRTQRAWPIDRAAIGLRGRSIPLAKIFTISGRSAPLTILSALALGTALVLHLGVTIPLTIIIAQLLSQGVVEGLKRLFNRERPSDWIGRRDIGLSFPSGHATTATAFYGSWLIVALNAPLELPLKCAIIAALALWILGIDWSRLALGAHYPTDILGGTLIGVATLCLVTSVVSP